MRTYDPLTMSFQRDPLVIQRREVGFDPRRTPGWDQSVWSATSHFSLPGDGYVPSFVLKAA
jgi:hypothetical protein